MTPAITMVLPTYNERENLALMVEALLALPLVVNILIVDDNSPDGTGAIADGLAAARPERIAVLHRAEKNGLGPAYVEGFKHALNAGADYIFQMDTDFSHQPKYVPQMVARLEEGYDIVLGSRFAAGGGVDQDWSPYRKLLTRFANGLYVRTILNMPIADATGGFRVWRREVLIGLDLDRVRSNGYVFQVEIAYVAHRLGFRMAEVPIYFPDRRLGISKMNIRIQIEAAMRVWQVWARHRTLTPSQRRQVAYPA